jgi:hypothetical protein
VRRTRWWTVSRPYPAEQRAALLPSVVRVLLASFLEGLAGADGVGHAR